MRDFDVPTGASEDAAKAIEIIKGLVGENASGGGCRAFYTPEQWRERGETYGNNSVLVIVHDGGALASLFNWDYCDYDLIEKGRSALEAEGFYAEQCTSWYSAVYRSNA